MSQVTDMGHWYRAHVLAHRSAYLDIARRMLGEAHMAEDIVHDVIAELMSDDRWKAIPAPRMYLMRAIYNRCVNIWRRRQVVSLVPLPDFETMALALDRPDATQILEAKEGIAIVKGAIDRLPPQIRNVIILRTIENMSVREISRRFGTKESVVHRQVKRGRAMLVELMASYYTQTLKSEMIKRASDL
ncbi:RNA polymerase sigma factor [Asticcacaulis endophyticus]|uniref:RNA polymerase sigma factor n=1 Tax=Asticcacaulis endophyticus TaxID=1395890 RepID=UPI001677D1A5|nr:sigma-70 family RNA polymerase sigma factor [Asticcacaulis endophyticus]